MNQRRVDVLGQVEARIEGCGLRAGRDRLAAWADVCPSLRVGGVRRPHEVPEWLWGRCPAEQDRVLRVLVRFAQDQEDELALLVVIACLRPGLLRLARTTGLPVDDVVAEATARVLEFPVRRRNRVAAGIVLDTRHRFWSTWRRRLDEQLVDPDEFQSICAPGGLSREPSAGEELVDTVVEGWRSGCIRRDDARLIIETRVLGTCMKHAARDRSLGLQAGYWRRRKAEAALIAAAQVV
jgi:hypothetical protein